ncbi:MAG: Zn-ribbon containing protein [Candidatus Thermoplasmatota archaeon]|jgi:predicted  nucleic acid-binding Zn-ribbon protein|nr:Zn-ribbon containing protein [Candidatus Thermoplasmatota archaeon]
MPHQCLKCGLVFEEGSSQLLKGCSSCGGNRFFFTKEPLNEEERNNILQKMDGELDSALAKILCDEKGRFIDKESRWVVIKQKDIQALQHKTSEKDEPKIKEKTVFIDDNLRRKLLEKIESEVDEIHNKPETIDIEQSGSYNIDLKGLLEEEPIIIQKDGSYTIHLPSVFKMLDKNKK